jgi:hypothetical protein
MKLPHPVNHVYNNREVCVCVQQASKQASRPPHSITHGENTALGFRRRKVVVFFFMREVRADLNSLAHDIIPVIQPTLSRYLATKHPMMTD